MRLYLKVSILLWAEITQSVQRLATGWMFRGSNPGGVKIFLTVPKTHTRTCTMGTGSFPKVKWPGHIVNHPPLSNAEVKEIVELYRYSVSGRTLRFRFYTVSFQEYVCYCKKKHLKR
jgi:hypothetical protein